MKALASNAIVAIVTVASVLSLIVAHEVLSAIAGDSERFAETKRWVSRAFTVLGMILAGVIVARFYYLRSS
jgi:hypothetical protein